MTPEALAEAMGKLPYGMRRVAQRDPVIVAAILAVGDLDHRRALVANDRDRLLVRQREKNAGRVACLDGGMTEAQADRWVKSIFPTVSDDPLPNPADVKLTEAEVTKITEALLAIEGVRNAVQS